MPAYEPRTHRPGAWNPEPSPFHGRPSMACNPLGRAFNVLQTPAPYSPKDVTEAEAALSVAHPHQNALAQAERKNLLQFSYHPR